MAIDTKVSTRDVKKGDIFNARVEENPSTGYSWKVVEVLGGAEITSNEFIGPTDQGNKTGSQGNRLLKIRSTDGKPSTVKLLLYPPAGSKSKRAVRRWIIKLNGGFHEEKDDKKAAFSFKNPWVLGGIAALGLGYTFRKSLRTKYVTL